MQAHESNFNLNYGIVDIFNVVEKHMIGPHLKHFLYVEVLNIFSSIFIEKTDKVEKVTFQVYKFADNQFIFGTWKLQPVL